MSDQVEGLIDVPREFLRDGLQFMHKCQKPDRKEFVKISQAIAIGFLTMGTVGYVVKLSLPQSQSNNRLRAQVHIPINNILVGAA
ncbi:hypothetical protein CP533_4071 [Ophiocordyceps camponoti-saundersi (nom. inval.)]|nr:hypothetical protein CP533_4071 [Ophiocordyceps camponoti-saundersi (nom. inval.)]